MRKKHCIAYAASGLIVLFVLALAILDIGCLRAPLSALLHRQCDFKGFTQLVHEAYVSGTAGLYDFVDLNGLYCAATGRRVDNGVMKLKNGMLTEANTPLCDVSAMAEGIRNLDKYVKSKGADFLYVQLPYKLDADSELLIEGTTDHSNENADALIAALDGVAVFDLREVLAATPEDVGRYFFRTDHHWNYYGAFVGFSHLLEELNRRYPERGIDLSCGDTENWESHTVKNWLLGSRGRRTGRYFGGLDDMTYYTPRFDTKISCEIPETGEYREGGYAEANLRFDFITGEKKLFEKNAYNMHIGGDYGLTRHRSESAACDMKVLLIKESFALPMQAYLSTAFSELDAVDPRYTEGKKVKEYIDELNPELVILMLNPNIIHLCPNDYSDYGT